MRVPARLGLGATALSLLVGAPGAWALEGEQEPFVPVLETTSAWLQCDKGPTKEYAANWFLGGDADTVATWGPAAPASVTTGAGCGKADDAALGGTRPGTPFQYTVEGPISGNTDSVTITLHTADLGPSRASGEPVELSVRAVLDGKSLFGVTTNEAVDGTLVDSPADVPLTVTPVGTGATGGVRALTFTLTNLGLLLEEDAGVEHRLLVDVGDASLDNHVWMWGAAEAPSGVVVNPDTTSPAQLKAQDRLKRKPV